MSQSFILRLRRHFFLPAKDLVFASGFLESGVRIFSVAYLKAIEISRVTPSDRKKKDTFEGKCIDEKTECGILWRM